MNANSAVSNLSSFYRVHVIPAFLYSASFPFTVCYRFISCFRAFMFNFFDRIKQLECTVFLYFVSLPFFQRFCAGLFLLLSYLSKSTILLNLKSKYGLVNELDWINLPQTENSFILFHHRCPSVLCQTSF